MLHSVRQYCIQVLVLFSLFVGAATIHPLVHTHEPGHAGCHHGPASHGHSHGEQGDDHDREAPEQHKHELPCDLHEAMASMAPYVPVVVESVELVSVGFAPTTSLPVTCRGAWGTFGGRGPPTSIS